MDWTLANRITVSLAKGQKDSLEDIATANSTTVAFVVRYIFSPYLASQNNSELLMSLPPKR